jgi:transcription antitermination factor NusG
MRRLTVTKSSWYVLQVIGGEERKTAQALSHVADATAVPERFCYIRHGTRIVAEARLLIPGYVFVQVQSLTPETYYKLTAPDGVLRLLGKSGTQLPEPIPEREIDTLLALYQGSDIADNPLLLKADRYEDGLIVHGIPPGVEIVKINARQRKAYAVMRLYDEDISITYALDIVDKRPACKPETT